MEVEGDFDASARPHLRVNGGIKNIAKVSLFGSRLPFLTIHAHYSFNNCTDFPIQLPLELRIVCLRCLFSFKYT